MERNVLEAFNRKLIDIPVLAVTGGKGGTGKTTVAVNLAVALSGEGNRILLVDADVDSPTTAIILGVQPKPTQEVKKFIPKIIEEKCNKCGKCVEVCRAHALIQIAEKYPIFFEELCSGCEACLSACALEAIQNERKTVGHICEALDDGVAFVGGELKPNEARSAQVVTATREVAFKRASKKSCDIMIVDSPPGTHCSVVQSLRGADLALAVTEPTPLGIYDLDLILRLTSRLGIRTKIVINKADLPGQDEEGVHEIAEHYQAEVISEVPVDAKLFQSYIEGNPLVVAYPESPAAAALKKLAESVLDCMKLKGLTPRRIS